MGVQDGMQLSMNTSDRLYENQNKVKRLIQGQYLNMGISWGYRKLNPKPPPTFSHFPLIKRRKSQVKTQKPLTVYR